MKSNGRRPPAFPISRPCGRASWRLPNCTTSCRIPAVAGPSPWTLSAGNRDAYRPACWVASGHQITVRRAHEIDEPRCALRPATVNGWRPTRSACFRTARGVVPAWNGRRRSVGVSNDGIIRTRLPKVPENAVRIMWRFCAQLGGSDHHGAESGGTVVKIRLPLRSSRRRARRGLAMAQQKARHHKASETSPRQAQGEIAVSAKWLRPFIGRHAARGPARGQSLPTRPTNRYRLSTSPCKNAKSRYFGAPPPSGKVMVSTGSLVIRPWNTYGCAVAIGDADMGTVHRVAWATVKLLRAFKMFPAAAVK